MIVWLTASGMPRPQASATGFSWSPSSAHVVRGDADQGVVVDAVVLALELHDLVAARVGAGDAHRVHRRLGAGHGHPGLVDPAGQLLDELDRADLVLARQREADALAHPLVDVVVDPLVVVAEDDRAVAQAQVDELVAVEVPDRPALAAIDVDRVVAPGAEVRVRATWEALERALVERHLALAAEGGRGAGAAGSVVMITPVAPGRPVRGAGRPLRDTERWGCHGGIGPDPSSTRISSSVVAKSHEIRTPHAAMWPGCVARAHASIRPMDDPLPCRRPSATGLPPRRPIPSWRRSAGTSRRTSS